MAVEDLEYVEHVTGKSLDDDKPLSDIRRRSLQAAGKDEHKKSQPPTSASKPGAVIEQPKSEPKVPEYDWFDFFLKAGVNLHQCERYAFNFNRDSMDETVLPDITPEVLRTLGLKEGDILRVTKHLDSKYGRTGAKSKPRNVSFGGEEVIKGDQEGKNTNSPNSNSNGGGLFSRPGGALRNNTRKGRPAPAIQNDDVVDAKTFKQKNAADKKEGRPEPTPLASVPLPEKKSTSGFDDDAWDVKPSKQTPPVSQPTPSAPTTVPSAPSQPPLTGALAELSLLSVPLQPTVVHSGGQQSQQAQAQAQELAQVVQQTQQTQPTGPNPLLFSQSPQPLTGPQSQQQSLVQAPPTSNFTNQQTFQGQQAQQIQPPRQRPQAPPITQQGSLILPPGYGQFGNGIPIQQTGYGQQFPAPPSFPTSQAFVTAQPTGSSFVDPRSQQQQQQQQQQIGTFQQPFPSQITGYPPPLHPQPTMQPGSINSMLPPPLQPQLTGNPPPVHPQPTMQPSSINSMLPPPLQPQLTGTLNGFATGPPNGYSGGRPPFGHPPPIPSSSPFQLQMQQQQQQPPPPVAPLQPQKTGPAPAIRFGVPAAEAKKLVPQPTGRRANLSHASRWFSFLSF